MQHPAEVPLKVGPLPLSNNVKNFGGVLEGKKRHWDTKFLWGNKEQGWGELNPISQNSWLGVPHPNGFG